MLRRLVAAVLLVSAIGSPVAAQEDSAPLREMLRYVPEAALSTSGFVSYVDYRAVESARPGVATPASYAAWKALGAASLDQWLAAFSGVIGGSAQFLRSFPSKAGDWPGLMGFDFFDADRQLSFGAPPADGLVVAGRFEPLAIAAAHEARGFSVTDEGGGLLICSAAGCKSGLDIDLAGREPADPFGGALGRKQPLFVSTEVLLSSAVIDTVRSMQEAAAGTTTSLAEAPDMRTALAALPAGSQLRQAVVVSPRSIVGDEPVDDQPSRVEALPTYSVALIADTATSKEQIAHVVLVFASAEDANAAAEIIPERIDVVESITGSGPLRGRLEERGLTAVDIDVSEPQEDDGAAVDVAFHAPLAGAEPATTDTGSSGLYRLLIDMLLRRDALWIDLRALNRIRKRIILVEHRVGGGCAGFRATRLPGRELDIHSMSRACASPSRSSPKREAGHSRGGAERLADPVLTTLTASR